MAFTDLFPQILLSSCDNLANNLNDKQKATTHIVSPGELRMTTKTKLTLEKDTEKSGRNKVKVN